MKQLINEPAAFKQVLVNDYYISLNNQLKIINFSDNCIQFATEVLKIEIKTHMSIIALLINAKENLSVLKIQHAILQANSDQATDFTFNIGEEMISMKLRKMTNNISKNGYSCILKRLTQQKDRNDIFENMHLLNNLSWFTSHKLRGPLSAILGLIDQHPLLEIIDPQQLEDLLTQMKYQATNLDEALHTLNNLLTSNNETSRVITTLAAKNIKNILLLDDELLIHRICAKAIAEINPVIKLFCFTDGTEALEFLESFPIDLILLDINMPLMNGWEFLDQMGQKAVKISTIIVSSSIDSKDVNKSLDYVNVKGFIHKPIHKNDLKAILHNSTPLTYV